MIYTDSISKSFLTYGATEPNAPGQTWQDPTYLGFSVSLVTPIPHYDYNFNELPKGLFRADPTDKYSTYTYLMNRGETYRADLIRKFEIGFRSLIANYPWYFQKISGLADAWKIDPKNNWRGKDKKITIDTLESIDLRVSYLLDCYRKAVFDFHWHRWAVPDHMRMFDIKVIVCEIRNMKQTPISRSDSNYAGNPDNRRRSAGINPGFSYSMDGTIPTLDDVVNEQARTLGLYDVGLPWSAGTFYEFYFSHCELDVFSEAPPHLESLSAFAGEPASNKIVIKTPVIKDVNTYGLLGAILRNTEDWLLYDLENYDPEPPQPPLADDVVAKTNNFTDYTFGFSDRIGEQSLFNSPFRNSGADPRPSQLSGAKAGSLLREPKERTSETKEASQKNKTLGIEANPATDVQGWNNEWADQHKVDPNKSEAVPPKEPSTTDGTEGKTKRRPSELESNLKKGIKSTLTKLVTTERDKFLLGNVYGLSPLTIRGQVEGFIRDPVGTVKTLLKKFSSPKIGTQMASKVTLTGPELKLVKDIIGTGDMTSSGSSTSGNPGKTDLTSPNMDLTPGGSVNLQEPVVNRDPDRRTDLQGPDIDRQGGGKVNLQGPDINRQGGGKVKLQEPEKRPSTQQSVDLTSPQIVPSGDRSVKLTSAEVKKTNPGKTKFTSANINTQAEKKVNLVAPPITEKQLGETNLTSFANFAANPGKVVFKGPTYPRPTRQRTILKPPLILPVTDLPKVEFKSPEVSITQLGSVKFESAALTRDFLAKVMFITPPLKPVELGKATFR